VDETGEEIFADKIGAMLARDLTRVHGPSQFVVDVKSTGLFLTDPVLKELGAKTDYWKTGHSYIKRRVQELNALAGFEKSGHFFFNAPVGRGYDDGLVTAIAVIDMLERSPDKTMSQLYAELPKTWGSPTMAPHCADEVKYDVVTRVVKRFEDMQRNGEAVAGQAIRDLVTVNGVRVVCDDGTWGLVRASSNKPELGGGDREPGLRGTPEGDVRGHGQGASRKPRSRCLQPDHLSGRTDFDQAQPHPSRV
jgi:phosphomannomutase/phosphoglucomutase